MWCFAIGYLNIATSRIAQVTDFEVESGENAVEVEFVDEDDFPLSSRSVQNFLDGTKFAVQHFLDGHYKMQTADPVQIFSLFG